MKQEWPSITNFDQNGDPQDGARLRRRPATARHEPADRPLPEETTNWDSAEKQGEPGQEPPFRIPR